MNSLAITTLVITTQGVPAGNLHVREIRGRTALVSTELRDTGEYWFYWRFRASFPEAGPWTFKFDGPAVGTRGPAVSHDGGSTWSWLSGDVLHKSDREFTYIASGPETVDFCQCIPYLQTNLEAFLAARSADSRLSREILCTSRKGRPVELVRLREGTPSRYILLTSRHHAQEAMACYAAEGILDALRADTPAAHNILSRYEILWVPFTDKDGVEDGDQGKRRLPHDHARDYGQPDGSHIYPETAAIEQLVKSLRPEVVLDLHCPWLRGGPTNEWPYLVGCDLECTVGPMHRLSAILQRHCPSVAPYRDTDTLPYGMYWNKGANYAQGMTVKRWAAMQPYVRLAQTIEIPFANFRDKTQTPETIRAFGAGVAASLAEYLETPDAQDAP